MKNILFCLAFLFAFIGVANGQGQRADFSTTTTMTNADTTDLEFSLNFKKAYEYSVIITADSLTGAANGFIYLQVSNDPDLERWATIQTLIMSGTQATAVWEGTIRARKVRLRYASSTGSQTFRVYADSFFTDTAYTYLIK